MFERELGEATRMARAAGDILLDIYKGDFGVSYKGNSDPVTEADRRANEYLVAELRRLFPSDGVVAEESADRSDALKSGRCWYVDPLDGTKEFIAKNGEFSVMLGLAVEGASILGVVYKPDGDKLYRGIVGSGATLEHNGTTKPLRVRDLPAAGMRLVVSRSHRSDVMDDFVNRTGIEDETKSGSVGLKVGLIAEEIADVYVHFSDKSCSWDACGPDAIIRAAGGRFTDLAGDPFVYGGTNLHNSRGILACSDSVFSRVLPAARELGQQVGLLG